MARGVRGGSKASRDSQKRLRNRKQRKKWAQEIEGLEGGKNYKLVDPGGFRKKRRIKSLKSKLNIPDKPQTNKDHLGRDSEVGAKNRKKVRETPASDETIAKVKAKLAKDKADKKAKEDGADERQDKMTPEQTKKALELYNKRQKKTPAKTPNKEKKSEPKKSNVFTRHYKTGKELGVMTRSQRRKYDAEAHAAGGKSFGERVDATGDKSNKRETNYIASQRKKPKKKITLDKIKDDLKVKPKADSPKMKEGKKYPRKKKNWKRGF